MVTQRAKAPAPGEQDALTAEQQEALVWFWDGGVRQMFGLEQADLEIALGLGNAKMSAGDLPTAFRIYTSLVLCDPSNFRYQQGLANFCIKAGEYESAIQAASSMIVLKPDNPLGYYFSGAACLALGYLAEAKEDIADALAFAEHHDDPALQTECQRLLHQMDAP